MSTDTMHPADDAAPDPLFDEDSSEYGYPETGSWRDRYDTEAEWRGER